MDWNKLNLSRPFFVISMVIWFLQASYSALNTGLIQQYNGMSPKWLAISIYAYTDAIGWWFITLALYVLLQKIRSYEHSWTRFILIHVPLSFVLSLIQRCFFIVIAYHLIKWTEAIDPSLLVWENFLGMSLFQNTIKGVGVYFIITGILYGYIFYERSRSMELQKSRLESQLARAKIENLKYQFQPHFLFNSLQSVSTLMHRDVQSADRALGNLGDLLRHSIQTIDNNKIPLSDELYYLQKYIEIQKTRYSNRLESEIECSDDLLPLQVPSFLLQPVAENSIKHGIEKTDQLTKIKIHIYFTDDMLVFNCRDFNKNSLTRQVNGNGTGLRNLKLRLQNLYGEKASLHTSTDEHGFETKICIPLEIKN